MTHGTHEEKFSPAWWLPDGHSQTLWRKLSPSKNVSHQRERIELDDGDFIDLDWCADTAYGEDASGNVVFILHGLCGSSTSSYVLALQSLLAENGISSVAMNFRGCSGEINRLATAYHSGISEDVDEVISKLSLLYPSKRFSMVGYSLGANVLLKWLGESQKHPLVDKAVAVSTPFSLTYCSKAMLKSISKYYGKFFVSKLVKDFTDKRLHFDRISNEKQSGRIGRLGDLTNIASIWEFDDKITAPLHGFKDAEDYYEQCSSSGYIDAIGTNTLLIQSANDPLIPVSTVPVAAKLPANIRLQLSPNGGHVGFISGKQDNWLEHRILGFIQAD